MEIGTLLMVILVCYYTRFIIKLFNRKNRKQIQDMNIKLEEYRKIPVKTIEQQKEFSALKYPPSTAFKFNWKSIPKNIFYMIIYLGMFLGYRWLFMYFGIEVKLWVAICIMFFGPLLLNFILRKFNLQQSDIGVFFR